MTQLDIHPEHLIDRVLRGAANEHERAELALHVRACPGCAAEWQLARALREPSADAALPTNAAVEGALAALTLDGHLAPPVTSEHAAVPAAARAWLPWAAALCLFFTGSAAAATLIMAVRSNTSTPQATAAAAAQAARVKRSKRAAPVRAENTAPAAVDTPAEVVANPQPVLELPPAPHARRTAATPKSAQSASELFAQGRAAELQRDYARAAASYAALQQRFAQSPQAHVAQVVLGRLYLEHLADPRAALAHFDAYLSDGGPNRPEALLGRARALRALGRRADEVATLRQLVDAYPDSLYVEPARERLRAAR